MAERLRERPPLFRGWPRGPWASGASRTSTDGAAARRAWAIAFGAGLFLAVLGPFGTSQAPLIERLVLWLLGIWLTGLVAGRIDAILRQWAWLRDRHFVRHTTIVALLTAPVGLLLAFLLSLIEQVPIRWPVYLSSLPQIFFQGVGLVAVMHLAGRPRTAGVSAHPVAGDVTLGGLLPSKLAGAQLLALEAQDHYVRVHTQHGAALVLMPFETALERVAHLDGNRVHRSWWVARASITAVKRGDGRATLSLSGNLQVPVSRRYARLLRGAGWY